MSPLLNTCRFRQLRVVPQPSAKYSFFSFFFFPPPHSLHIGHCTTLAGPQWGSFILAGQRQWQPCPAVPAPSVELNPAFLPPLVPHQRCQSAATSRLDHPCTNAAGASMGSQCIRGKGTLVQNWVLPYKSCTLHCNTFTQAPPSGNHSEDWNA